jgi:hypothetical protein
MILVFLLKYNSLENCIVVVPRLHSLKTYFTLIIRGIVGCDQCVEPIELAIKY